MQNDEWEYEPVSQNKAPHKIFIINHGILCQRELTDWLVHCYIIT